MPKIFYNIYIFFSRHKLLFGVSLVTLMGVLAIIVSQMTFEEDISKLIPTTSENRQLQDVLKTIKFNDKIIVNIQKQEDVSVDELTDYATSFLDSLERFRDAYIKDLQGYVDDETALKTVEFVYNNLPLFLNEDDYDTLSDKIREESIDSVTKTNYKTLLSPSGIIAKQNIVKDPLGISYLALQHLKTLVPNDDFILKDNFLVNKNEQNLLLFLTPKFTTNETKRIHAFSDILIKIQKDLERTYGSKVQSEYYGGALIALGNAKQIKRDVQLTVTIALILLVLVFVLFYKKVTIPIILFIPTLFGGLLAVAILFFIRDHISAISLGIGSVLLGVTLDYSLHILTHIRNKETVKTLFENITNPILMSSLTTALAFLCLLFINSQALQDLGIFAAVSSMGASVFALVFIPQVYSVNEETPKTKSVLDRLASYKFHANKVLIIAVLGLVLLSVFTYNKVVFNNDLSALNYESEGLQQAKSNLDGITNLESKSLYLTTVNTSLEGALKTNDSIFNTLERLQRQDQISSFNSLAVWMNSESTQNQKLAHWEHFWTPQVISETKNQLVESGKVYGFKPEAFQPFYDLLNSEFQPLKQEDFKAFQAMALDDFISSGETFSTVTSIVKLKDDQIINFKNHFKKVPNILVIDRQELNENILGHLKDEFNSLILYCLIVILVLLMGYYKNVKLTLVTTIPILLTWLITVGLMGWFHLEFNVFNVIISTFIFGLGIDYSIFITNGLLNETSSGEQVLATHKTSVVLSVITTILGIGVLIFAKHPALHSVALITIIGILSAVIIAFTIQPLLFKFFKIKPSIQH